MSTGRGTRTRREIQPGRPTIAWDEVATSHKNNVSLQNTSRLLTPKLIRFIAIGFKFGEYFHAHPHRWRKGENRPETEMDTSRKSIIMWWLNIIITSFIHFSSIAFVAFKPSDLKPSVNIYLNFLLIADTIVPCNQLTIIMTREVLPMYVTSAINYALRFEKNYMKKSAGTGNGSLKTVKIVEKFLDLVYYGLLMIGVACIFIPLFIPHVGNSAIHLLLHINPDDKHSTISPESMYSMSLMFRAMWVVIAIIMTYNFVATSILLIFTGFPLVFVTLTMINQMSWKNLEDLESSFGSRNNVIQVYRQIKIFVLEILSAYGFAIAYNKVLMLFVVIYSLYGAITSSGTIALFLGFTGINGVIYLAVLFTALGKIHVITEMRIAEWKSSDVFRDRLFRRKLKTLTSMKIYVLTLYFVDRSMVLTMLEFIINSVVNLLVM